MLDSIINSISQIIVGNHFKIKLSIASIISEGSILIEDYPGTGKTTFAKTITHYLGMDFKRIQFTSDLLPSDILGFNYFKHNEQIFQKGPIFTNIVLADELNRGSPKTQSSFLEAMEEKNVSIDGVTYNLPEPFFVIATQNPMDSSGTSSLPDSQLDRFMVSFSLSDLNDNQKKQMLKLSTILNGQSNSEFNWNQIKNQKKEIIINDIVYDYVLDIEKKIISLNETFHVSPRCLKQILELAKGWALINGKKFVTHQDIKDVIPFVLRHRIRFISNDGDKNLFINNEILNNITINK